MSLNRWALVVGACDYEFHPKLNFAASDAVDFAKALIQNLGFEGERVIVLADGVDPVIDHPPTRRNIFHALGMLASRHSVLYQERSLDPIGDADQFVFYYSGHGIRKDHDEFLLPIDTSDYAITETAVPLAEVVDRIENLPCRHKVLFLDACREQFYPEEGAKAITGAKGIGQRQIVDRQGLATFYSCDPGQLSFEIDDLEHGSFTYCLLEAVKHPNVNTLGELDDFLKSRVPEENRKAQRRLQQPFFVPNPRDMLDVELFRLALIPTDREQLLDMTTELFNDHLIDVEWWEKLSDVWESGDALNYELKRMLFERLHKGDSTFDEFQKNWGRTEKYVAPAPSAKPDLPTPQVAP